MIHPLDAISVEKASPWPSVILPQEAWQTHGPQHDSSLDVWRGVAIGLPISAVIWLAVVAVLAGLL